MTCTRTKCGRSPGHSVFRPEIQHRMPFPGPGLAVRIIGEVTREKIEVVREANWIVEEELVDRYHPWQCFAAVLGLGTGVKGDNRVHGWIVSVRAVNSRDGMTADPIGDPVRCAWRGCGPDHLGDPERGPGGV